MASSDRKFLHLTAPKVTDSLGEGESTAQRANISAVTFIVDGQHVDVPVGVDHEVSAEMHKTLSAMELPSGYKWSKPTGTDPAAGVGGGASDGNTSASTPRPTTSTSPRNE